MSPENCQTGTVAFIMIFLNVSHVLVNHEIGAAKFLFYGG